MNDNERGLYSKYEIAKNGEPLDGSCFVLRPDRDPAAVEALRAYAAATPNKDLAQDIVRWVGDWESLTLQQVEEIIYGGESPAIWVHSNEISWVYGAVLDGDEDGECAVWGISGRDYIRDYGVKWLAYTHKPVGELM